MRLLELFSGTKSVSKAIGTLFNEIVSIDILQKFHLPKKIKNKKLNRFFVALVSVNQVGR